MNAHRIALYQATLRRLLAKREKEGRLSQTVEATFAERMEWLWHALSESEQDELEAWITQEMDAHKERRS